MNAGIAQLEALLQPRLDEPARNWLEASRAEIAGGVDPGRLAALFSMASRYAKRSAKLDPNADERAACAGAVPGWDPERWTMQEALRVALLGSCPELEGEAFAAAYEELFRYADEGEQRALYRALALLPGGERFAWRAGEGCRTNIVPVFEAVACDTPYPAAHFDDVAWNQLVIKAVFIGAPLWRVQGLDGRLSPELARMALDLVDERRSAGRRVQHELWLCLGEHAGERGLAALETELDAPEAVDRRAAVLALGRAGIRARLESLAAGSDELLADTARAALTGAHDQGAFRALDSRTS